MKNTTTLSLSFKNRLLSSSRYHWLVIALCASLLFYKYILNVSPSIMSTDLMRQFHIDGLQLGNLAATYFYIYTIVQIFSGILLDKYGARWLVGLSILVAALGAWLFSIAQSMPLALVARGMMGFGIAFATVNYLKMTAVWFKPSQSAFVGGLLATAVMLGAVFGEAPMAALLDHTSWRFVMEFCSLLGLLIGLLFLLLVRDKPMSFQDKLLTQSQFSWAAVLKVLKNKQNWLLTLYSGLAWAPLSVLGGLWGNPFIQEAYQVSRTESASLVSLMFIGLGLGSPFFGFCSDRLGSRVQVMKIGVAVSLIALLTVLYFPHLSVLALAIFLFLVGFGVGSFMLGFTLGVQINALALGATVVALINTGDNIFESFTEPFLGRLLDLNWTGHLVDGARYFSVHAYKIAFIPLPIYFLVALALLFFIKEDKAP